MASNMTAEELAAKLESGESVQLEPQDPETPPAIEPEAQIENKNKQDASPEEKASLKAKPWKEYAQERRQWREEKESIQSELNELKTRFEKQDSKEVEQELQTKIDALAQQEKASPAVIKGILDLAKQGLKPSFDPALSQEMSEYREQRAFQKEWDDVLPELVELYPNASYIQLRKAERLMDDLSHSEDYSLEGTGDNIGLLDILEAEEDKFNTILASAKSSKGFETRERGAADRGESNDERRKPDFENMSFDQIREWENKRDTEDDRLEREMREKEGVKRF